MLYVCIYVNNLQTFLDVVYGLIDYTNKECAEVMLYTPLLYDAYIIRIVFLLNSQIVWFLNLFHGYL